MTMSEATLAPVRRSIVVAAPIERAFHVFTAEYATWTPPEHHLIGDSPLADVVLEPREGGRWYEVVQDGRECDWGRVLAWEPPHRVVLSWQITPQFTPEPDPERASEVEVRFVAEADDRTRVELEHRGFERHGEGFEQTRAAVDSEGGWTLLL